MINRESIKRIEADIGYCLGVLHSLQIVHMDIKPANFLWHETKQKYILCDFGISQSLKESRGEKTYTSFNGSYAYMGKEMLEFLRKGESDGFVDLYLNDIEGLEKSMERLNLVCHGVCGVEKRNSRVSFQNSADFLPSIVDNSEEWPLPETEDDPPMIPSYYYYQVFHASTSLTDHHFHLIENLPGLSKWEIAELKAIMLACHSSIKMLAFLEELKVLPIVPPWIREIQIAYCRNI